MILRSRAGWPALAALALAALPPAVAAQADHVEAVRRAAAGIPDSAAVRVIAPGVYVDPGLFLGLGADSIRVADADVQLSVAFDEVEELAVRSSRWLGVSLMAGGIAAVFGGAAGFFIGTGDCGFQYAGCGDDQVRGVLRWGGAFAAAGLVMGAVLGSRMERWKTVFP